MALAPPSLLRISAAAVLALTLLACPRAISPLAAKVASAVSSADEAEDARPNRILFEYVPPKNPQLAPVYKQIKERGALEKVQQLFSPFRIPIDLTVKTVECGQSNAWYQRPTVNLCYEYLDVILQNAPKE